MSEEPIHINDSEMIAYITKRVLEEYHYKISPRVVSIVIDMESEYYDSIGLSMSEEEFDAEVEVIDQKWSMALLNIENIIDDIIEMRRNESFDNYESLQVEAKNLQDILLDLSGKKL
jgi:hypothetical protein